MERIIKKLFRECFNIAKESVCYKKYYQWIELEQRIEEFKKSFNNKNLLNRDFIIDCYLFQDTCNRNNIRLDELIELFNSENPDLKLKIDSGWRILFPYKIFENLMYELTNKINEYILKIINEVKDIKYLILTGGASINPIIQLMIQENIDINQNHINIVQSHNPELAISQGSVLFAYDHNITSTRKAKYTFGIKALTGWNEKIHKNGGIKEKINNEYKCVNYFSKIIKKNDDISPEKEFVNEYTMVESKVTVEIYKTEEDNVLFCDQKNEKGDLIVSLFAKFTIDVGNNYDILNREAKVCMKLGGTFIYVSAIYCKTGEKEKLTCLFE